MLNFLREVLNIEEKPMTVDEHLTAQTIGLPDSISCYIGPDEVADQITKLTTSKLGHFEIFKF
jgi:hypothetical protein